LEECGAARVHPRTRRLDAKQSFFVGLEELPDSQLSRPDARRNVPGDGGGNYSDGVVSDEFFWAAAELFAVTGDGDSLVLQFQYNASSLYTASYDITVANLNLTPSIETPNYTIGSQQSTTMPPSSITW